MSKIIVGLDIGTTKIACFVGQKNEHGKIEILSMGQSESLGVRRGMVSNIEQTVASIKAAVKEAQERVEGDLTIGVVNVGIAGQHIKSIQHRGMLMRGNTEDLISQKDIDALIDNMHQLAMTPGDEIINVIPQEFIVDAELGVNHPIGMPGNKLEANFHIIVGNITAAKNIRKCVINAGLQVDEVILEPIASADAVLSMEEKEAGVVLVDIGGGTTDVAVFYDGIIRHTAVIPFGGNVITDDIKDGCTIMKRQAEMLKVKFGSALVAESLNNDIVCIPGLRGHDPKEISIKNLASIIQARMEEIIDLVYYEIANSGYEKKLNGGIVITGGGSQLKHITQLFEYVTGMNSRIGYPTEHLASNTHFDNLTSPIYATGIGLVLKGFDKTGQMDMPTVEGNEGPARLPGHSDPTKRGVFFKKIMDLGKSLFPEGEEIEKEK